MIHAMISTGARGALARGTLAHGHLVICLLVLIASPAALLRLRPCGLVASTVEMVQNLRFAILSGLFIDDFKKNLRCPTKRPGRRAAESSLV